jgi:hypothetical protein
VRQATIFLDLALAPKATAIPASVTLPDRGLREQKLIEAALQPFLAEIATQRTKETKVILDHLEISLNELIHRQNMTLGKLHEDMAQYTETPNWLLASIKQTEDRIDELNGRLERRRAELAQEAQCSIGEVQYIGSAWVLPHPERSSPSIAPMVRDEEIERIAVETAIAHETARGWVVESVEKDNRGFDLISRRPHPEDPKTAVEVRFIEVKGRASIGEIAVSDNEYNTADRLKTDYWLYVVFNCGTKPELHLIQDPSRLSWRPVVQVAHYHVGPDVILEREIK